MDCFCQTKKKTEKRFKKPTRKSRPEKWTVTENKSVLCFPLSDAESESPWRPTNQTGEKNSTRKSAGYMEDTFQMKKTKIKLHKNLLWIYLQLQFFSFFFFKTFLFFLVDTVMLHRSKAFPVVCSIIFDMQVSLLSWRTKAPPHHIPLRGHTRPNHRVWASPQPKTKFSRTWT